MIGNTALSSIRLERSHFADMKKIDDQYRIQYYYFYSTVRVSQVKDVDIDGVVPVMELPRINTVRLHAIEEI